MAGLPIKLPAGQRDVYPVDAPARGLHAAHYGVQASCARLLSALARPATGQSNIAAWQPPANREGAAARVVANPPGLSAYTGPPRLAPPVPLAIGITQPPGRNACVTRSKAAVVWLGSFPGVDRVEFDSVDERVLVYRPGVRGALA